jgi:hypothetical protein
MKRWALVSIAVAVGAASGAVLGCNGILGIDSADLDPTFGVDSGPSGSDAGTDASDGAIPQTCDFYCNTIQQNCTGIDQEYTDTPTCLAMCQNFDPGFATDTMTDSLGCRIYHSMAAAGNPDVHCRHAGPTGAGTCGSDPCQAFCLLDTALCGSMTPPPYDNGAIGCAATCDMGADAGYAYLTTGDAGDISFQSGDTLNCRIYHLEAAYNPANQPAAMTTHCPHTAQQSAVCF